MWEDILRVQRCNVDSCLVEKKTQLSKRTMKLTLMDVDGCTKFKELNNTVLKRGNKDSVFWQACLYEARDDFIKVARKLDYSCIPLEHILDLIKNHLLYSLMILAHCLLMLNVLSFIILLVEH